MPNRILKESICSSETIAQLSRDAEVLFYRLIVNCDDYGRFDGRPAIVRARCFPLLLDQVAETDVLSWLDELTTAGLIHLYQVDSRRYLQIVTWGKHQQVRATASKYPPPPADEPSPPAGDRQPPAREPATPATEAQNSLPLSSDSTCYHAPADDSIREQPLADAPVKREREALSVNDKREALSGNESERRAESAPTITPDRAAPSALSPTGPPTVPLASPPKAARPKTRDPTLDHPAVVAYHALCKLTPNETQRAAIATRVSDVERWSGIIRAWLESGWKPTNVHGMLERYTAGPSPLHSGRHQPDNGRLSPGLAALALVGEERQ